MGDREEEEVGVRGKGRLREEEGMRGREGRAGRAIFFHAC